MEVYPFHNVLHSKVCEIFICVLEKNSDEVIQILDGTDLLKIILDIAKENAFHKFEGERNQVSKGFNVFLRKIANKVVEVAKQNEEASNILESIPAWQEYRDGELANINERERKPLAQDPRNKKS